MPGFFDFVQAFSQGAMEQVADESLIRKKAQAEADKYRFEQTQKAQARKEQRQHEIDMQERKLSAQGLTEKLEKEKKNKGIISALKERYGEGFTEEQYMSRADQLVVEGYNGRQVRENFGIGMGTPIQSAPPESIRKRVNSLPPAQDGSKIMIDSKGNPWKISGGESAKLPSPSDRTQTPEDTSYRNKALEVPKNIAESKVNALQEPIYQPRQQKANRDILDLSERFLQYVKGPDESNQGEPAEARDKLKTIRENLTVALDISRNFERPSIREGILFKDSPEEKEAKILEFNEKKQREQESALSKALSVVPKDKENYVEYKKSLLTGYVSIMDSYLTDINEKDPEEAMDRYDRQPEMIQNMLKAIKEGAAPDVAVDGYMPLED